VVFECDFQVIRGGGHVVDRGGYELESNISLDEEWTYPLALRIWITPPKPLASNPSGVSTSAP
jgi:hypothetical protein